MPYPEEYPAAPLGFTTGDVLARMQPSFSPWGGTTPAGFFSGVGSVANALVEPARNILNQGPRMLSASGYDPGPDALSLGLTPITAGMPLAQAGAVGSAGGKLPSPLGVPRIENPIKAYHGSPHDFDKFDASKIGTGEGAQAYGHGLYFAESPTVAETYKNVHGTATPTIDAVTYMGNELSGLAGVGRATLRPAGVAQRPLDADGLRKFPSGGTGSNIENFGVGATPAKLKEAFPNYSDDQISALQMLIGANGDGPKAAAILEAKGKPGAAKIAMETADQFSVGDKVARAKMYEVALHAEPQQFLDWDKPLSQQPSAYEKIKPLMRGDFPELTGEGAIRDAAVQHSLSKGLPPALASKEEMATVLREAGIPGIRYKDQLSRGAEGGTSNYVVFPGSESLIEILRKYGMAGLIPGGFAASQALQQRDQQ